MRTEILFACLAALTFGCGGGDGDSTDTEPTAQTSGDEGSTPPPDEGSDEGEDGEAEDGDDEEEDGMSCLPVSRCHSFANQACALVDAEGAIQGEELSAGSVERACPGERDVADSVQECFDYVEISESCRRRPELRHPEWPCGRTDTARCGLVM